MSQIEALKQKLESKDKEKHNKPAKERKMRFDMRKKAKRSIINLTSILTKIGKMNKSENDYALIFRDDKSYFEMLKACNLAYSKSFESKMKLRQNPEEFLTALQIYSMKVGLKVHSKKQLSNRRFQNKVFEELKKNPTEYLSFSEYYRQLVSEKTNKKIEELFKKELQCLRDGNSTFNDLYSEKRKKENAFQIAARVYGKLLEDDEVFLTKTLEQIRQEFL